MTAHKGSETLKRNHSARSGKSKTCRASMRPSHRRLDVLGTGNGTSPSGRISNTIKRG